MLKWLLCYYREHPLVLHDVFGIILAARLPSYGVDFGNTKSLGLSCIIPPIRRPSDPSQAHFAGLLWFISVEYPVL